MSFYNSRTEWADIVHGETENEYGDFVPTVTAKCWASGKRGEETFGDGIRSINRALLTLTRRCHCGATFHSAAPGRKRALR